MLCGSLCCSAGVLQQIISAVKIASGFCAATEEQACHRDHPLVYGSWVERDAAGTSLQSNRCLSRRESHVKQMLCGRSIRRRSKNVVLTLQMHVNAAWVPLIRGNKNLLVVFFVPLALERRASVREASPRASASTLQALCGTQKHTQHAQ